MKTNFQDLLIALSLMHLNKRQFNAVLVLYTYYLYGKEEIRARTQGSCHWKDKGKEKECLKRFSLSSEKDENPRPNHHLHRLHFGHRRPHRFCLCQEAGESRSWAPSNRSV